MKFRPTNYKSMNRWQKFVVDWVPNDAGEWHFAIWFLLAVVTLVGTAALPIVLSIVHGNWLYMSMYYIIMVPIVLEVIFFAVWFGIFLDR